MNDPYRLENAMVLGAQPGDDWMDERDAQREELARRLTEECVWEIRRIAVIPMCRKQAN